SRRRHTRFSRDWSSDVCSSDLDKGHGRKERREYYVTKVPDELRHTDAWKGLKAVGMAVSERDIKGKTDGDIRYFILSFKDVGRRSEERRVGKECREGEWACSVR